MLRNAALFLCLLFVAQLFSLERALVRIPNANRALLEQFQLEDADIAAFKDGEYLDLVYPVSDLPLLQQEHPALIIRSTEAMMKANLGSRDIPGYRTYQEMLDDIYQLEALNPSLVQIEVIGSGWGKQYSQAGLPAYQGFEHDIHAIKLSANVSVEEDEPAFYFIGAHHAREPISMEVCIAILEHLVDGYGIDPQITSILDSSQIWFVPLMNPDGRKIVLDQTDVWWRKNVLDNNENGIIDIANYGYGMDGVDINRNYSHMWGNISASNDPYSVTYHGSEPFSEPETSALKTLLESRRFLAGISYHTYGEWVLYPYGYASNLISPDAEELSQLATNMANTIGGVTGGFYTASPSYGLYPVSGSFDDWSYGTRGTFSYTIEMADQFIPPASQVPLIIQNHFMAAKALLMRKNNKTLTGHISDASSGNPVRALIYVEGIDNHYLPRADYLSDLEFGAYWRFLPVGTHTVRIVCEGYLPQSHEIVITGLGQTVLDVALEPATTVTQIIRVVDDISNPLSGAGIQLNDFAPILCDENGELMLSNFLAGEYRVRISHPGYSSLDTRILLDGSNKQFRLTGDAVILENFESGSLNWQLDDWGLTNSESVSGSYSLSDSPTGNYQIDLNNAATLNSELDLSEAQSFNVKFMAKWDINPDGDHVIFGYFPLYGTERTIHVFQGAQDWTAFDFDLSYLCGSVVKLFFRINSNESGNADGIYIDDFAVYASSEYLPNHDLVCPPLNISYGPNPFHNSITIDTSKNQLQNLDLEIYNLRGQKVFSKKSLTADATSFTWDGRDLSGNELASGIYFLRLQSPEGSITSRKILKLK